MDYSYLNSYDSCVAAMEASAYEFSPCSQAGSFQYSPMRGGFGTGPACPPLASANCALGALRDHQPSPYSAGNGPPPPHPPRRAPGTLRSGCRRCPGPSVPAAVGARDPPFPVSPVPGTVNFPCHRWPLQSVWFQNRRAKFRKQERAANAKGAGGNPGGANGKKSEPPRSSSEDDESKESNCSPTPDSTASLPAAGNLGSPGASLSPSPGAGAPMGPGHPPPQGLKAPIWAGVSTSSGAANAADLLKAWQPAEAVPGPFSGVLSSFHRKPNALKTNLF
ncbi:PHX2A protein, partial [Cepphus grylle]|nr:PHX2A protein [Cepphus grylle]